MLSLSYALFLFVLLFAPLAFATVETWARAIVQLSVSLSVLLLALSLFRSGRSYYLPPGSRPLFLLAAWILFQLLPLPVALVRFLSPATVEIYQPLLEMAPAMGWLPLTVHPKVTFLAFCQWTAAALCYLLTVQHLSEPRRLKQTVAIIAVFASLLAIEAIVQKLTSPTAIYWLRTAPKGAAPMGPFVYNNQFAGFMEMVFPLVLALFLFTRPRVRYEKSIRARVVALFTLPGANRSLLLGTGVILIALSILLSLSRGGIITLCLAFLGMASLSSRVTDDRHLGWGMVIIVSLVLMLTWFGWQPIMTEIGSLWNAEVFNASGRLPLLKDGMKIFADFPLTGTGFGTFQDVYLAYQSMPGDATYDHAHNDYLELLTDGGLIGVFLGAWFVLSIFASVIRTLRQRREKYCILLAGGALTGMLALLLHCFIDFQMASGANSLYFFFLCGLAVAAAHTRLHYQTRPTLLLPQPVTALLVPALFALTVLFSSTWLNSGILRADHAAQGLDEIYLNPRLSPSRLEDIHAQLSMAARLDPLEAEYRLRMGHVSAFGKYRERALAEYLQACRRNPASGACIQQLGLALPGADPKLADMLLASGITRGPRVPEPYLVYSRWLLAHDRREQAIAVLNQAVFNAPEGMADIARFLGQQGFTPRELERILSGEAPAWFELGRTLEAANRPEEASRYYRKALALSADGETAPEFFRRPYELFRRMQQKEQALAILRQAIATLPEDPWFRIQLGDYYAGEGILYRAREEYLQALRSDPDNREIKERIRNLDGSQPR